MLIEQICNLPSQVVMIVSAIVGASVYAGVSIYRKKKADKKFKFDWTKIADTTWQSAVAGSLSGLAIGCGWYGVLIAFVSGIGLDKICSKFSIKERSVLNVVEMLAKLISSKDKKW